jgi:two-component system sensor histidine kinase EvgS
MPLETKVSHEPATGLDARNAILIVEDNHTNALILRAMLLKSGYDAVVASDGVEGVEMAFRLKPPLVLLDLHMPRLDGFAAAAEMLRQADGAPPLIVAVTADASPEVQAACLASGFIVVLTKPVVLGTLISTVRRFVQPSVDIPKPGNVIVSGENNPFRKR